MRSVVMAFGLVIVAAFSGPAIAQKKSGTPDLPDVQKQEELMDSISEIGLIGGHAIQCEPKNDALGTQALKVGDHIPFGCESAELVWDVPWPRWTVCPDQQMDLGTACVIKTLSVVECGMR